MRTIRQLLWASLLPICIVVYGQDLKLPLHSNSVRFAAIGDWGTGSSAQYQTADRMARMHEKFDFDFVITLGDNIYGGDTPADFVKKFELPYKALLDEGVKFYASLGNHDRATQKVYKPFNMNGQQYYTYKKGNAQFFALDTDYMSPEQLSWLEKELKGSGADWKICYFHHPLYSSAKFHGSSVELRSTLEPILIKGGVQVVFAGHDHVYERVKPQHGIVHFVEGSSGELRKGNLKKNSQTDAGYDVDQTFLLVEISGDDMDFQAISRSGKTIDSGNIHRVSSSN